MEAVRADLKRRDRVRLRFEWKQTGSACRRGEFGGRGIWCFRGVTFYLPADDVGIFGEHVFRGPIRNVLRYEQGEREAALQKLVAQPFGASLRLHDFNYIIPWS